jgi:hypothetical protein
MSERLDVNISDLPKYPDRDVWIAAVFRDLLRARDAGDLVAQWLATNSFCSMLCNMLADVLKREPSWDSEGRWLDCLDHRKIVLVSADRVKASGAVWWNLRGGRSGGGAEPFEADLAFSPGMAELVAYSIRFKDQRDFPSVNLTESVERCRRDLDAGAVPWAFVFRQETRGPARSPKSRG